MLVLHKRHVHCQRLNMSMKKIEQWKHPRKNESLEIARKNSFVGFFSRPFVFEINGDKTIILENRFLSVNFSKTGILQSVHHLSHDEKILFTSNVIHYGTSAQNDHNSGAYLFIPDGEAKEIPMGAHDLIRVQRGPLVSRVDILHEMYALQYTLTNVDGRVREERDREKDDEDVFRFGRLCTSSGCDDEFKYE